MNVVVWPFTAGKAKASLLLTMAWVSGRRTLSGKYT
jgi:hypothetical protein